MRKIHLLIPTILVASSIPMVSMVGCGKKNEDLESKYLTFTTTKKCTFCVYHKESGLITHPIPNLQYSINGGNWNEYTMPTDDEETGVEIPLKDEDIIQFRGNNPNGFCYFNSVTDYSYWNLYFYNNDDLACGDISGNVMSLLSKDNFKSLTKIPCNGCFYCLFEESNIFDAYNLVLPATKLSKSCYEYIFDRCPNLVYSPKKLPAATLDEWCYYCMFEGCISLTTAPTLSATTLAEHCCDGMFYDCSSLTTAPELQATELAEWCYCDMFSGCISLEVRQQDTKTVDEGFIFTCPTDLPDYAVVQMFASCITTGFTGDPTPGYSYYWYTE